jgi:hypothetical protein
MYRHMTGFDLLMASVPFSQDRDVHQTTPTVVGRTPMVDHRKREEETEREIEEEAAAEPEDPITSREALEEELMDEGRSDQGEHIP